jgi:cobalt-zinc-cadmium resistance protein CzcA
LAVVVEGGLVSSTFLTLLVIPIVYSWLRRRSRRGVQLADRLDAA